uniref:C6 domain-containing protein n=1 Tax=Parastrongyloides trichosuri TaxID=131310 RepID=A0A0N4Z5Z8_PARTI
MKHLYFILIILFIKNSPFTYSCASNGGGGTVNPTTTISPDIDDTTITVTATSSSTTTVAPSNCASCTTGQITWTPSTSTTTGDATFSNYELDGEGCYTITAICDASDNAASVSFMQFNIDQGGPLLNGQNVITAVLNCRDGQWVYIQEPEADRVVTEVNCIRT